MPFSNIMLTNDGVAPLNNELTYVRIKNECCRKGKNKNPQTTLIENNNRNVHCEEGNKPLLVLPF